MATHVLPWRRAVSWRQPVSDARLAFDLKNGMSAVDGHMLAVGGGRWAGWVPQYFLRLRPSCQAACMILSTLTLTCSHPAFPFNASFAPVACTRPTCTAMAYLATLPTVHICAMKKLLA